MRAADDSQASFPRNPSHPAPLQASDQAARDNLRAPAADAEASSILIAPQIFRNDRSAPTLPSSLLTAHLAASFSFFDMSLSDSFAIPDVSAALDRDDDIDSLPSSSTESFESDDDFDAQKEWETSLEQLQLLLTMIVVPFVGKYFGRKFAYWSTSSSSVLDHARVLDAGPKGLTPLRIVVLHWSLRFPMAAESCN